MLSLSSSLSSWRFLFLLLIVSFPSAIDGDCLANKEFNDYFEYDRTTSVNNVGGDDNNSNSDRRQAIPRFGSCCMYDVCGLQCPKQNLSPTDGTLLTKC